MVLKTVIPQSGISIIQIDSPLLPLLYQVSNPLFRYRDIYIANISLLTISSSFPLLSFSSLSISIYLDDDSSSNLILIYTYYTPLLLALDIHGKVQFKVSFDQPLAWSLLVSKDNYIAASCRDGWIYLIDNGGHILGQVQTGILEI